MCLKTKEKNPKIAKEDIVVYVIREHRIYYNHHIFSPFFNFYWNKNELYTSSLFQNKNEMDNKIFYGFHSFITLKDAKKMLRNRFNFCTFFYYKIHKAIIPKDSLYWTGKFNTIFKRNSYCSNKLILKEIVN
jgi:hypothetical protein